MTSRLTFGAEAPSAPTPAPTILLVENDSGNRTVIEMLLLAEEFGCIACANYEAGCRALDTHTISLIVADLGTRALDLIARVRENPALAHIPIIVVTGSPDVRIHQETLQAGADACHLKPIPNDVLLAEIRRCLDNRSA